MLFLNVIVVVLVHLCIGGHLAESYSLGGTPKLGIIRGSNATKHEVPSIVFVSVLKDSTVFNCGGSLILKQYVLTAGHCVYPGITVRKVYLGLHKFDRSDANQTITITNSQTLVHPDYKKDNSSAHDIGLIKLPAPVTIYPGIVERAHIEKAATFDATNMDYYAGKEPTMYGWGLIEETPREKFPKVLQLLKGIAVPYKDCKRANRARNTTLCVKRSNQKLALACRGDSGSPLILDGKQIGVVSGGSYYPVACHRSEFALFARLDYHRAWINKAIWSWK